MADASSTLSTDIAERLAFERGAVLANRYEMKRPLGRGGMGEVWLAYDLRLRVDVALKRLLPLAARPESLHDEIRTAREVISPNVCRVFDLVESGGHELLSMEFVDGTTLREVLEQRSPLDFFQAQEIAAQFLAGLEAIHAAGLVHRDFKPENVMLTRTGRVVVMDFGLARAAATESHSISGTRPYMAPEQFLGRPADRRSDVFAASVVLAEMLDPKGVHDIEARRRVWQAVRENPASVADGPWSALLRRGLALSPDERPDSAAAMARGLEDVRRRIGLTEERSPYPGLASFTEADAQNFFGRDAEIAGIWKRLSGPPRLLGVIGPSGAGKSSLMRAGIIPARPEGWRAVIAMPGAHPFRALAAVLAPDLAGDVDAITAIAGIDEPDVAVRLFASWRRRHGGALLIVDQFEELFTLSSPHTQARFAEVVARLPIESDVHVVLSMRDDFLIRCHDYESLAPLFSELIPLRSPTGDALRRALVQPALNNGYRFEDESLVEEIVGEISDERAALPLGAFAMSCLWEKRDRQYGTLTRAAYEQIGGVAGSLARHAEATLEAIGTERGAVVREMFRSLVTAHGTRASRDREELLSMFADRHEAGDVLDALIRARLVTSYEEGRVEIIHESLLRSWPRLVQWQAQDTEGALFREHLRKAAELWEERGRPEELLWSGNEHREYQVWRARYAGALSTREEVFAQQMEAAAQRHTRRRQVAFASAFLAAIAIAATFGVLWKRSTEAARRSTEAAARATAASRLAEAQKLLALAEVPLAKRNPTAALAYARKSLEIADTPVGRLRVLEILGSGPIGHVLPMGTRASATMYIDFSPGGEWLLVTSPFGPGTLFKADGAAPRTIASPVNSSGQTVRFSPDNGYVALQSRGDPVLHVYRLDDGKSVREIPNESGGFAVGETVVTVTPTSATEAVVRSWPFTDGSPTVLGRIAIPPSFIDARLHYGRVDMMEVALEPDSIMPDGSIIYGRKSGVYRQRMGEARPELLWDVGETVLRANVFEEGATIGVQTPSGVAVRLRDGTVRSVTSSALGVERIIGPYDIRGNRVGLVVQRSGDIPRQWLWDFAMPSDATEFARDLSFDSEGKWLAASVATRIQLFALNQPASGVISHGVGASTTNSLTMTSDGQSVISCGIAGGFRRWPLTDPDQPGLEGPRGQCNGAAVTPDGRYAAAGIGYADVFLISLVDGTSRRILEGGGVALTTAAAIDPAGEIAAVSYRISDPREPAIRLVNLRSGETGPLAIPGLAAGDVPAAGMAFGADGTLYIAGDGGIRQCNVVTGSCTTLRAARSAYLSISGNRRFLLAATYKEGRAMTRSRGELVLFDLQAGTERRMSGFGNDVMHFALTHDGTIIASKARDGVITIGAPSGERRYVIAAQEGGSGLAFSRDGRWLLSSTASVIRRHPMPDLSERPMHTLPLDELLARLHEMTNLRAVEDPASSTGYKLEPGPFEGWRRQPRWQ